MVERKVLITDAAPPAVGPYAQGVRAGTLVFSAGQLPIDSTTGTVPEGVEAQTRQSLANVAAVLEAGGASLASAVKTTVFLKNMDDFAAMNAVYATFFSSGDAPARSTVEVARLPRDVLVEIEAIAVSTGEQ
jgi:2-iminobutanoate/2-iminopropanoate deaminase